MPWLELSRHMGLLNTIIPCFQTPYWYPECVCCACALHHVESLPTDSAFRLVTEYGYPTNQAKPFSCNPSNTWQWSLTNVESKPTVNQPLTAVRVRADKASPAHRALRMARVNGCARPAKAEPACGNRRTLPQFAATLANPTSVGQSSPGAGNLWGGGEGSLSLIST